MRSKLWFGLVLMLSLFSAVNAAFAATILVPTDQPDIQTAVGIANPGDTILVEPGTYNPPAGGFQVNKSLIIKGQKGAANTIIEATAAGRPAFVITADNVTVFGFTLRVKYGVKTAVSAIIVGGTDDATPIVDTVNGTIITKNIIHFYPYGINLLNADSTQITSNTIRFCPEGYGSGGVGVLITILDLDHNGTTDFAVTNTLVQNNIFYENGREAVRITSQYALTPGDVTGTKVFSNTFYRNGSFDFSFLPPNNNSEGIRISDVLGGIEVTNNKFLALSNGQNPINVNNSPGVTQSGNTTFPLVKWTLSGGSTAIDP